jgi:signal transduction histidine kinase
MTAQAFEPQRIAPGPSGRHDGTMADQVRTIYQQTPASLVGNLAGALIVIGLFSDQPGISPWVFRAWCTVFGAAWVYRLAVYLAFNAAGPVRDASIDAWARRWNVGTLVSGALWGVCVWMLYAGAPPELRVVLLITVFSFCLGSIPLLATQFPVFVGYCALNFVPTLARILTVDTPHNLVVAMVMAITFVLTTVFGRAYRRAFDDTMKLKARIQQQMVQLREENEAAVTARREAEVANRAKTQFFAAASHDLRQPLHALGLFAEALRSRSQDEEVIHLVNSINSSVDALEGLFSELLDITKIDTGGVEARPAHFALDAVFSRLRLHFEPTAFEKGLDLRFRGGRHHAFADPVLVERVLRNLLSNAIRYTPEGSVMVSARQHRGRLLLQVWDTGVGIREKDVERIFEEFYQVHDPAVAIDPDQRRGLGLGLSIVKRLAALMHATLSLRSREGHGTVFTLEVPVGRAPPADTTGARLRPQIGVTLDHRLIVVVEDDAGVRRGLEVLLKSWGASVASFDSVAACLAWARQADLGAAVPDLLITDYRLEEGVTGLDAIRGLRERFGDRLPAIVVTGSMMSGFEREAQEERYHVLVKPVVPNKLRAMIGFKLGTR